MGVRPYTPVLSTEVAADRQGFRTGKRARTDYTLHNGDVT